MTRLNFETGGSVISMRTALTVMAMFLILAATSGRTSEQVPAPQQSKPIALLGGTVHPVSGPAVEGATILFDKGKIVAVGRDVAIPADALRIEIPGKHVWPALIDAVSNLGLVEISAVEASVDAQEIGDVNPNAQAQKAINPDSERLPVTRSNGIGLAVSLPAGGLIPGQGALIMLDGWTWEQMTVKAPLCLVLEWPDMSGLTGLADKKTLAARSKRIGEQIEKIETSFRDARAYMTAKKAAGSQGVPFHAPDVRWEAMIPVLEGSEPVWVRADALQQIEAAVEWADRVGVKMVLVGGEDAPLAAEMLKRRDIPVIVDPVLRLPRRRDEAYDDPLSLAERLRQAGIRYCIAGGASADGTERDLPYEAAMAAAYGLPREEALKAVTLYAAQVIGVEDRLGSLEPGKDASLIVTDGDPLEVTTSVERMYLQGRPVDLGNRQKSLYSKYREKYRQAGVQ